MIIPIERLSKDDIRTKADEFNSKYNPEKDIPVPVELIVEAKLNIDIVPISNLRLDLDNDGFISGDFSTIYIDQDVYLNIETRYRFSIAHEIGHFWLHENIYKELEFSNIDEWQEIYYKIDDADYSWLEKQANNFAGLL